MSHGRTALVTGASRGIGKGISLSLARQGFGLTITSRSDADLTHLAEELREAGAPQVMHAAADMSDREALPELVELHARTFGSMNALVANAGVGTMGSVIDFPMHRVDKTLHINLVAAMVLIQAALPLLRLGAEQDPERGATIIGLSSITGVFPEAGLALYGATKAALISLIETVNLEEAPYGVTATAIAPGYVNTDMSAWKTDTVPVESMIRVADVVAVANMLLDLGAATSITRIVMARRGSAGHQA
ncbi:MAG: hypothetical protein QOG10_7049 [Kribbellaceae bacterium]|nr:hypothetical protein [Kribbellaceae bacterium]